MPLVKQLILKLEAYPESKQAKAAIEKIFTPIFDFKSHLSDYTSEDKEIIKQFYPIIFGAVNIELFETKSMEHVGGKVAVKVLNQLNEYSYEGTLKLETDLPCLFVPQQAIQQTRNYLAHYQVKEARVYTIAALCLASKYHEFKQNKISQKNYQRKPRVKALPNLG